MKNSVSFNFSCDGVSTFNNSTRSVWPFILSINEISKYERYKRKNTFVFMLISGKIPKNNLLLASFVLELIQMHRGFFVSNNKKENIFVNALINNSIFDLPGKAKILLFRFFNGAYGCTICIDSGLQVGRKRIWPIDINDENRCGKLRTLENTNSVIKDVENGKESQLGIVGVTLFHKFPYFKV